MLTLLAPAAFGQVLAREPLDLERFKPAVTAGGFVVTEGSGVRDALPGDPLELGLFVNGSLNPLVVVGSDGLTSRFVSGRLGGDVMVSGTLVGPLAVGLSLPFFVAQGGDLDPNAAGIGDVRFVPKLRLLDDRRAPLGLALLTEVRLPTHSDDEFSGGARSPIFAPKLAVDHHFPFGLRLGANGGVLLREATTFENVEAASELTYSAAATFSPGGWDSRWAIGADVHGGAGLGGLDFEELPLEAQLFASVRPRPDLEILGGPAFGLVPGYGTPTFRAFVGVRFAPTAHDADHDGITDEDDGCPDEAESRNGVDDLDGCPDDRGRYPATVVAVGPDKKPVEGVPVTITVNDEDERTGKTGVPEDLPPGRYPVTVEAEGYQPTQAVLVVTPDGDNTVEVKLKELPPPGTVAVTIIGPDGQPVNNAMARVDDARAPAGAEPGKVEVEVASGQHVLWVRAKGYVPQRIEIEVAPAETYERTVMLQPIEIELTDERLNLSGTVYFDTGSARLVEESHDLLDEVALTLEGNPQIKLMRVEGHTDSQGSEAFNQKLSEDRAASVVAYLVSKGIAPGRLEAVGYGETRPISDDLDENRRVEFVIVRGKLE